MPEWVRNFLLLTLAVVTVAGTVWAVQEHQARQVDRSFEQGESVQQMLAAMLDQETGLRGFVQTGEESFLEPLRHGRARFADESRKLRRNAGGLDASTQRLIDTSEELAREWQLSADNVLFTVRAGGRDRITLRGALRRKNKMDAYRAQNAELLRRVERARARDARTSQRVSVALVVLLATVFGAGGWVLFGAPAEREARRRRGQHRRRERQSEFARTMQVMDGEQEAHDLVKRHLERSIDTARVVVLQRNNSADRLEATTAVAEGTPLAGSLVDATPRSCMAVRLGATHAEGGRDELLSCELCGKTGAERTLCTPLVVSGEVIGSVLVAHDAPLGPDCHEVVDDTVAQAAPVLANMRNLAIAEIRAATDALTGLANRRSVQDTVRRMVAHAARAASPLAVIAIDVDHFKRINDRHGHDRGDDVLAAVGQTLAGTLRASDFVGRQGGEEFVALLPDTDLSGAITAAENLRRALEALDLLPGAEPVTASFGVAVMPEDGADPATLLRQADRALYAAKANGRNRVETVASGGVSAALSPQTAG